MINAFDQEDHHHTHHHHHPRCKRRGDWLLDRFNALKASPLNICELVLRVKPWGEPIDCLSCLAVQRLLRVKFVVRHRALPAFRPSAAIIARC